ncbi:hypothetical protein LJR030_001510 [Rhizobium sp. LjRoot30]|uniref:hypothetical protein n=1 Tax=Rhizobium sp. LjRoot30 TaxID=3342320 RepID=UPI003ED0D2BE
MTTAVLRACCPAGQERAQGYLASPDGDVTGFGYTNCSGPAVGVVEHFIEERTAWHEAAHAVIGYLAGWPIISVSIVPPERVVFAIRSSEREPWLRMVGALAGGAGEDARIGWFLDEPADSVNDFVSRAYDFCGGQCDGCRAATAAWQIVGFSASQNAAADQWRAAETEARRLCALPRVRAAIEDLANALMAAGTLTGEGVAAIISKNIKFGALAEKGKYVRENSKTAEVANS